MTGWLVTALVLVVDSFLDNSFSSLCGATLTKGKLDFGEQAMLEGLVLEALRKLPFVWLRFRQADMALLYKRSQPSIQGCLPYVCASLAAYIP